MTGFIAQEVEQAAIESSYDFSGVQNPQDPDGLYSLRYSEFVVPIVKAVQEIHQENQQLKTLLLQQQLMLDALKKEIDELRASCTGK